MNWKHLSLGFAPALLSTTLWAGTALAQTFSVDPVTPGLAPSIIYGPGPIALTPPTPPVDVDCFSYMSPIFAPDGVVFSVSAMSAGAPLSAVFVESTMGPGEQAADIFFAGPAMPGTNVLLFDGNGSTPPGLGLIEPVSNIDGLDATVFPPPPAAGTMVFFTISPATAAILPYGPGASAATIYAAPFAAPYSLPGGLPAPIYAPFPVLGLGPLDNVDGLHYMEDGALGPTPGDMIYFSLAPGSPSLGAPGPLVAATAADILLVTPGGPPAIFAPAPAIGLLAGDNIDALSMHVPGAGVPVEVSRFSID